VVVVKKTRKCPECRRVFVNPESLRVHKYTFGDCRSDEALRAAKFIETPKGWVLERTKRVV
jgi:hypothetical protein